MRTIFILVMAMLVLSQPAPGQAIDDISLNPPDMERGLTIMKALERRASTTSFSAEELSLQDLSDLLWAANGINRPESGKRTAPSALNAQDIDIYVLMRSGTYLYDAKAHSLKGLTAGDNRRLVTGSQESFAAAPVMLVMVSDISRFPNDNESQNLRLAALDAGMVSQNISLFCAAAGLVTRPRASMDIERLKKLLSLTPGQHLMINNPVGYPER